MNFDLSEEQRMLQSTLDDFLERECPIATIRDFYDGEEDFHDAVWKGLLEMGVTGLHLPEAYGGAGLELLDLQCVAERLGYHATPVPFFGHAIAGLAIALGGSDAQKEKWLPGIASGDVLATIAFSESDGRWQPDQWGLAPNLNGSLTATRPFVPSGGSAELVVVGLSEGRLGLVDTRSAGTTPLGEHDLDRTRRCATLRFDESPFELLANGRDAAERVRDAALVLLAADAAGGAQRCVELAAAYAKQREQFGRPIGHFQALKHQLADLALDAEPCRPLVWYAAHAWDTSDPSSDSPRESARAAAHAKSHVTDRYLKVARGTVEAHGGIGYTWESEVHYWLKRAAFDRAFLGAPRVHRRRAADLAGW